VTTAGIAFDVAAVIRAGSQPKKRRQLPPVVELAAENFRHQHSCTVCADPHQLLQPDSFFRAWERRRLTCDRLRPVGFNQLDLVIQKRQSPKAPLDLVPLVLLQRSAITGAHVVQLIGQPATPSDPKLADAMQRQQPTNAGDDPGAFMHEIVPFAHQASRIFFLRRRDRNRPAYAGVASEIRLQYADHGFGINAISLDPLSAPRNQKAGRVENIGINALCQQHAGKRKTLLQIKAPDPDQIMIAGVAPVRMGERLGWLAEQPMQPRRAQRPLDIGFWNPMRNQLEMF
jgi:hypothetical protein